MHFVQIFAHVTTVQRDPANCNQVSLSTVLSTMKVKMIRLQMMIHNAMDNEELDISDYSQDNDLLKLVNLLSDEKGNEYDVVEDVIDF